MGGNGMGTGGATTRQGWRDLAAEHGWSLMYSERTDVFYRRPSRILGAFDPIILDYGHEGGGVPGPNATCHSAVVKLPPSWGGKTVTYYCGTNRVDARALHLALPEIMDVRFREGREIMLRQQQRREQLRYQGLARMMKQGAWK